MNEIVGTHDILLIVLDSLRYDVAAQLLYSERHRCCAGMWGSGWKPIRPGRSRCLLITHFFAGFLPTPLEDRARGLFGSRIAGSETATTKTCTFEEPDIVRGLAARGYHTLCVGRKRFFLPRNPRCLRYFPRLFRGEPLDTQSLASEM